MVYIGGLIVIAGWNYVCIGRLIQCLDYIPVPKQAHDGHPNSFALQPINQEADISVTVPLLYPPRGTSTLGRVAWFAFGRVGFQIVDVMVVLLFVGIIVAYVAAVLTFVADTPIATTNRLFDAVITGLIMGMISLVPDLGYLSGASAVGLGVLLATFAVISGYGFLDRFVPPIDMQSLHPLQASQNLELWPTSLNGLSRWFGIVVFGYGIVPLTYNFQESMKEPQHVVRASMGALAGVAGVYVGIGVGLYALFPHLTADVLHELPANGYGPTLTRLAMSGTVLTTAPLLIVPCAELIEGKFGITSAMAVGRAVVRFGVVGVCVLVAVLLPNFVQVLSFVGCFCVALVSFCLPPLLHLRLAYLVQMGKNNIIRRPLAPATMLADVVLAVWGIIVTVVSTICTMQN
jgi:Transmembrane amino acid transporter protein